MTTPVCWVALQYHLSHHQANTTQQSTTQQAGTADTFHGQKHSQQQRHPHLVGIVGGIGPYADARLSQLIVQVDTAKCQNYLTSPSSSSSSSIQQAPPNGFTLDAACHTPYLLYSNPAIPNNNQANLGLGPPSVEALADTARALAQAGADVIALACTAAHTWRDAILQQVTQDGSTTVLDLLDLTAKTVAKDGHVRVGLVDVDGTIRAGLFQEAFQRYSIQVAVPDSIDQASVMDIVSEIKRGGGLKKDTMQKLNEIKRHLIDRQGVTAIVWGCTDVAALLGNFRWDGQVDAAEKQGLPGPADYDTLRILAKEIVRISNDNVV